MWGLLNLVAYAIIFCIYESKGMVETNNTYLICSGLCFLMGTICNVGNEIKHEIEKLNEVKNAKTNK